MVSHVSPHLSQDPELSVISPASSNLEWLVLDSSYVSDMFDVRDRYWGYREVPVGIYTFQGNYSTELTQVQFSQMTEALDANTMLVLGSCVNWWPAFIDFAESNATSSMKTVDSFRIVNSNRFDSTLRNFYNDDAGEPYRPLLHLSHDDVLQMSEITCIEDANENTMTYYIEQMNRLRDTANICSSVGAIALSYNYWLRVNTPHIHIHPWKLACLLIKSYC